MRKALFAIVLIAASFAGGAVVNGPGLRWAQTLVMNRLGIDGDDEPAARTTATAGPASEEIPARPIPPLIVEPPAPGKAAPVAEVSRPEPAGQAPKSASASVLPALTPVPAGTTQPPDPVAPRTVAHAPEPETPPLATASRAPDREKTGERDQDRDRGKDKGPDPPADPSVRLASVADPDADAPPAAPPASGAAARGEWAEVRDTMRTLGVSRYGIEGDPGGRVRFHCLIPLAGRRAVGQHFEAEGDDDLQAARSALKRVALWKAAAGAP